MTRAAVVLLAGGSGSRVGAEVNKVLLPLGGVPLVAHSVRTILEVDDVHRLVVVVRPGDREALSSAVAAYLGPNDAWIVDGGTDRHGSEWHALQVLAPDIEGEEVDVVAVHDAARPLAPAGLFEEVIGAAARNGGAIPVVPAGPLSHRDGSLGPGDLVAVQTPQAFRARPLLEAYRLAEREDFTGTDTAACLARYSSLGIVGVPGSATNLKVTYPEDLATAEALGRR
ncbi:MAG: IspD/TarI family cytidylyltransferase [Marmoricola sp.]